MSTRLYKRIGYGYAHSVTSADDLGSVSKMLNTESFLLKEENLPFKNMQDAWKDFADFADNWLTTQDDRTIILDSWWIRECIKKSQQLPLIYDVVRQTDEEDKSSDAIILTPLLLINNWTRFDDAIDYIEENSIAQNYTLESEVHTFNDGIYPYNTYIRKDTLELIDHNSIMPWIRARNDNQDYPDYFAQKAGFSSHAEALELVIPNPPADLVALALWGKLFINDDDAYRMSPIYYKWWG